MYHSKNQQILRILLFTMLSIVLVSECIGNIIPDLLKELDDYTLKSGTIEQFRFKTEKYERRGRERIDTTLIVVLENSTELYFRDSYSEYFNKLMAPGKLIEYYPNGHNSNVNPVQVTVDKKIIYDLSQSKKYQYYLVIFTLFIIPVTFFKIYSLYNNMEQENDRH